MTEIRIELLTGRQAAAHAGITYNAWKLAPKTRAGRPPPDDVVQHDRRRVERWKPSTIDAWVPTRRPTHVQILADPRRVTPHTARRHRRRHAERRCSCYIAPTKGQRI